MKKVGVTGYKDFLGKHLSWFLYPYRNEIEIVKIGNSFFQGNGDKLRNAVNKCDVIVHLSASHLKNSDESKIYSTNIELADKLMLACEKATKVPHIIYASSTQIETNSTYGKAKKDVGEMLSLFCEKHKIPASILVIPNEFGEFGEPFDTSVVSTFCHQLAIEEQSEVNEDASVNLVHNQEIAKLIFELIKSPKTGLIKVKGTEIKLSKLYGILSNFKEKYSNDIIPYLEDSFHISLFNTLRSHLFTSGFYPKELTLHTDERGSLVEVLKSISGGQVYISTTNHGYIRGNHYHTRKIERFCVVKGTADIKIKNLFSGKEIVISVDGKNPMYIDMPTFCAHNLVNTGNDELITVFWANEIYNKEDPDTIEYIIT